MNFDSQRAALGNLEKKQRKFDTVSIILNVEIEYLGMDVPRICRHLLRNAAKLSSLQLKGMQLRIGQDKQKPKPYLCHVSWRNCR